MNRILKYVLLGGIVVLHMILVVNELFILYFMSHLQYGTYINGIDVGGWRVSEVKALLEEPAEDYELLLKERGGFEEKLYGSEIGMYYEIGNEIQNIKEQQYPYWWIKGLGCTSDYEVEMDVHYDEALLQKSISQLECLSKERNIEPENAGLELIGGKYEIIQGDPGSTIIKTQLIEAIKDSVEDRKTILSLEEKNCYKVSRITVDDRQLNLRRAALNQYVSSIITYDFGDRQEVLSGDLIDQWIDIDYSNKVTLNEEAVAEYVDTLAETYDTMYGVRYFNTSVGTTVTVVGGDYGWKIDRQGECKALIELLKKGNQHITRQPVYAHKGFCRDQNDIGKSYVEINLTRQYLWFYKDGKLITEGSIVSGTDSNEHATPEGTYNLDYKKSDTVLRGPGYACPVSYWMPFNCDIGIHDATWRTAFGGSIYVQNGSHGCINAPLTLAKVIFEQVEIGMPVICYHDVA